MSWNEPGGGNNRPRDPWGGNDQGPPDLDEALKKLQQRLSGLFGGRGSGGGGSGVHLGGGGGGYTGGEGGGYLGGYEKYPGGGGSYVLEGANVLSAESGVNEGHGSVTITLISAQ